VTPNHLIILEKALNEFKQSFGELELIAFTAAHISEYCQNRQEKREAYRIAAKIIKCDRKHLKTICEKLDQLQSRLNLNFDGGVE
jgi:tRNA A37 N6-isopentenylltransferase MiaA